MKLLLLALMACLTVAAALAGSVAAQTDGGQADTLEGRIIARIQDRADADGSDDYRIEFGFLPQWAMDDKDPWTEAAATYADWLPEMRWLSKTTLDQRATDDDRRWLRSSIITVPRSKTASQSEDSDADLLTDTESGDGRVIARYQPDSRGRLRIEFGFLPEWTFDATADTAAAVQRYGADLFPRARFLSASMIAQRRDVWLRSSIVQVPAAAPTSAPTSAPTLDITRATLEFRQGEVVEATRIGAIAGALSTESEPISVTGIPASLTITAVDAGENLKRLVLQGTVDQDAAVRSYTVQISARPPRGAAVTATLTIRITAESRDQQLSWRGYSPSAQTPGESVTLIPPRVETGPGAPQWTYASDTPDICTVNSTSGALTLREPGSCRVTATSAAADGFRAGTVRATVTVTDTTAPDLLWFEYAAGSAVVGGDAILPERPASNDRVGSLSYRSETPRICSVDSRSGSLLGLAAGVCRATVISAETGDLRDESRTVTISVNPAQQENPPAIDNISCAPESPQVNEDVTCRAELRGGTPTTWAWDNPQEGLSGSNIPFFTLFRSVGDKTISLTVSNAAGSEKKSITVTVEAAEPAVEAPAIDNISCAPESPQVNEDVTCRAELSGGTPTTWDWDNPQEGLSGSNIPFFTLFRSVGDKTISLTVSNTAGSEKKSITVTVEAAEPAVEAPAIDSISCAPSSPQVDQDVTCRAELSGGTPTTWAWDNPQEGLSGSNIPFFTLFRSEGDKTISLTVSNAAGSEKKSITVTVEAAEPAVQAPVIDSISCTPSSPEVDADVTCTARTSGGDVASWSWSGGASSGNSESYRTSFSSAGEQTVSLTASNDGGSDTDSTTVTVEAAEPAVAAPVIDSISCVPESPRVNDNVTCRAELSGGTPSSWAWDNPQEGLRGGNIPFFTLFRSTGNKTISLTVSNDGGSDTESITVTVESSEPVVEAPVIDSISCTPSSPEAGAAVTCTASISGGAAAFWSWSGGASSSRSESYSTSFSSAGDKTVSLTASNAGGSDTGSTTVTVTGAAPVTDTGAATGGAPDISYINCTQDPDEDYYEVMCDAFVVNGDPSSWTWAWSDSDGGSGTTSYAYVPFFSSPGAKTVSLTVTNPSGSDTDSTTFTVE